MGFPYEGVRKAYKHNEKKTSAHIMTFSCTNIDRKSSTHHRAEKARQEIHSDTKI